MITDDRLSIISDAIKQFYCVILHRDCIVFLVLCPLTSTTPASLHAITRPMVGTKKKVVGFRSRAKKAVGASRTGQGVDSAGSVRVDKQQRAIGRDLEKRRVQPISLLANYSNDW
jgi:hypothetical protein